MEHSNRVSTTYGTNLCLFGLLINISILQVGNEVLEDSKTVDSYLLSEGVDPNTFSITLVSTMYALLSFCSQSITNASFCDRPSDMQQNQNTINTDEDPSDGSYSSTRTTYGPSYITNHDVSRPTNNGDDEDDFDSWEKRPAVGFVGLKNQGATCYLNSLIQVLCVSYNFAKHFANVDKQILNARV